MPYDNRLPGSEYATYQVYGQPAQAQMYERNGMQYAPHQYQQQQQQQQQRHVVQQAPRLATSPDVYQAPSHLPPYQQSGRHQEQYRPPYPPTWELQGTNASLQQQNICQQPQQYYQPQQVQRAPSQGFYQSSPGQAQVVSPYPPPSRHPQPSIQQQQAQHRTTPHQVILSPTISRTPQNPPPARAVDQHYQTSRASHSTPAVPTPQHRTVAHVQIPVQRTPIAPTAPVMPRAAKRRRSNDGDAVPVCDPPMPQKPSVGPRPKQAPMQSSPLTELPSSQVPTTSQPNVDYHAVLLSLSDEYVTAAYGTSASLASSGFDEEQVECYHRLISTGLGCLESVLKNYRQPDPRKEARIRLRFATLLHEETENSEQAEEVLSKGIALCERNRLTDLKYAMHHLLARVLAKGSSKAATKAVEKLVAEVEALKLGHWVYAFRFLRVSLGLQNLGPAETAAVLKHLSAIVGIADEQRHIAVQTVAAALEAMVHLKSSSADAIELAQRALAAARMHQLSPELQRLPQLRALLDCLDLAGALMQFKPDRIIEKMQQMHQNLDGTTRDKEWNQHSTTFPAALGVSNNADIAADTAGILANTADGEVALTFSWIHKGQFYALAYLLSGVASAYKHTGDPKIETFLTEGSKMVNVDPDKVLRSLSSTVDHADWQVSMDAIVRLQLTTAQCARSDWASAIKALREFDNTVSDSGMGLDRFTSTLAVYLCAVCEQGSGELLKAEALYGSRELAYDSKSKDASALKNLQAVACLNRIQILRHLGRQNQADELLSLIDSYTGTHTDKAIVAANYIVKAATQGPNSAIIKLKKDLQSAIQAARSVVNNQLLCIIMNLMTHMFFSHIVGEQAVKSARASRTLAKQTGSKLWQAVADRMYGDTLELCGEPYEADEARKEGEEYLQSLPETLRSIFAGSV